jgi:hypothetical protein
MRHGALHKSRNASKFMNMTGFEDRPPPIFVVGPPRSGTTLTARILGRHSRIFMPGETHFFDDIYARRRELGDLTNPGSVQRVIARLTTLYERFNEKLDQERVDNLLRTAGFVDRLSGCRSYKEILTCFMEMQMRLVGKGRWGNNVPKDIFQVADITYLYPDAKILVCIRDVRDFLLSYKHKWQVAQGDNVDRLTSLYHPVLMSLLWQASINQIAKIRESVSEDNVLIVHYESLVLDSDRLVQEICRFIGEDFEQEMLNVDGGNSSFKVEKRGIYSSSVGRWKKGLSDDEIHIAQKINGSCLESLGYKLGDLRVNPLKLCYLYATLPYGLWRALRANRAIRGPLFPYLVKRLVALWPSRSRGSRNLSHEINSSL